MTLIFGIVLVALAVFAFVSSLPRGGKLARFVGTAWEGYAVVLMIVVLGMGAILAISGATELLSNEPANTPASQDDSSGRFSRLQQSSELT